MILKILVGLLLISFCYLLFQLARFIKADVDEEIEERKRNKEEYEERKRIRDRYKEFEK